jgi:hypothetical protein
MPTEYDIVILILAFAVAFVFGAYFGYEVAIRRAEEWIEDHVARGLPPTIPAARPKIEASDDSHA